MEKGIDNSNSLPESIDPVEDSITHLVVISFGKSTSKNYALAVSLAGGAEKYNEILIGKNLTHLCAFGKSRQQAAKALTLLRLISGWKNMYILAGGKVLQHYYQMCDVLDCYLVACGCNDRKAHCHELINDPYSEYPNAFGMSFTINVTLYKEEKQQIDIERYVFPCRKLRSRFKFETDHPSTPEDQIQAASVEYGFDACPYFDATEYKPLGTTAKARV